MNLEDFPPMSTQPIGVQPGGAVVKAWVSDTGAVTIEFGPDGRVVTWGGKSVDQPRLRSPLDFVRLLMRRLCTWRHRCGCVGVGEQGSQVSLHGRDGGI